MSFTVLLAKSRGMCAGVARAIKTVEKALELHGDRVFVLHEVVHNRYVVEKLRRRGAHFVEDLKDVPKGSVLIFSAHGVGIDTEVRARTLGFDIIDATCPVVTGIHRKMNRASKEGLDAVVIGHKGHQEVIGTIGQYDGDKSKIHVVLTPEDIDRLEIDGNKAVFATQTTLSVDETRKTVNRLKEKYPLIKGSNRDDTCNATQLRQNAVKDLASQCDLVLIAGSANSSNSNRLREVAEAAGTRSYLVDDSSQIKPCWLENVSYVGVSAGASVPEDVVEEIIGFLLRHGADRVESVGGELKEKTFNLPKNL